MELISLSLKQRVFVVGSDQLESFNEFVNDIFSNTLNFLKQMIPVEQKTSPRVSVSGMLNSVIVVSKFKL